METPLVLHAERLTKRYGRRTALTDCDLMIPRGHVVGLVGPNGAGKSTLLQLACGLLAPTAGTLSVLGSRPAANAAHLARVGFVAQDTPVYASFSIADHLRMGAWLNPSWDPALAKRRIAEVGLDPAQKAGRLSGGQRAQLALAIAAAKRPELLIFDEPAAALDPLARKGFMRGLVEFVGELGASAVLSSHLLSDVEQVCDYLVVLCDSRIQIAGPVRDLLASHHRIAGDPARMAAAVEVIWAERGRALVRGDAAARDGAAARDAEPVTLEELVLAYMSRAAGAGAAPRASAAVAR
ncbi:ABC transporter ATP-binding protein [Micromonospora sp. 4G57]|uniref:ABC transporter ATP-binding protein n=1 Tax=Micromonospora sicca TaxID=2202420 RepID=A0ABU5J980_9ACTN|nr:MULTISPECIES: ABC transporter ATP-binding protein [unclassified Micromonospora]MDZ5442332.1 ABC transporter ATP-binding protein [Micromonospora sp. 4G57]MDZ5489137.1 ABC transporter ATP-binding protein [Micromonospora sp. 4G53]